MTIDIDRPLVVDWEGKPEPIWVKVYHLYNIDGAVITTPKAGQSFPDEWAKGGAK